MILQQVNLSNFYVKSILSSCELFSVDSSKALQVLTDAEREFESLVSSKDGVDTEIQEIFNVHGFGAEGEWKKLDGTCLEIDAGECVHIMSSVRLQRCLTWVSIAIRMKYVSLTKLNKSQTMVELRSALGQYLKQVIYFALPLIVFPLWRLGNLTLGTRHPMSSQGNQSTTRSKSTNMVRGAGTDRNVMSS